jgi:hypothetical protein
MSAPGRLDSPCTTYNWQGALTKAERWLDTVGTAPCSGTMLDRIEYTIDPTGRRIGRRVEGGDGERYLYGDALNPIARLDAANRIEQVYVYGKHAHVPDVIIQYNPATGAEVERYAVLRICAARYCALFRSTTARLRRRSNMVLGAKCSSTRTRAGSPSDSPAVNTTTLPASSVSARGTTTRRSAGG